MGRPSASFLHVCRIPRDIRERQPARDTDRAGAHAEGEADIARRIERGKLAVLKSISRTRLVATTVIALGDQLHSGDRTIRELANSEGPCRV